MTTVKEFTIHRPLLSDILVKVLKTMIDKGVISLSKNDKMKMVDAVHRVICNRENEWSENDSEEKLMDEILGGMC